MAEMIDPIRTAPAYSIAQAARLAHTKPHNVRNWLYGSGRSGRGMEPVFGEKDKERGVYKVSFLELAELIVVAKFRNGSGATIPLKRLRAAHRYARESMAIPYPFASGLFKAAGGHIIHEFEQKYPGRSIAIDTGANFVLPMEFNDALTLFDFDPTTEQLAKRWYPAGRQSPLVIEPGFGAGWPVIEGRNVRAQVLLERWHSGMDIEAIADDYQLDPQVVEAAIKVGNVAAA